MTETSLLTMREVVTLYENQDGMALATLAIAIIFVGSRICPADYRYHYARRIAGCLCLPYLCHLYPRLTFDDFSDSASAVAWLCLLYLLILGPALFLVPFLVWLIRKTKGCWFHLCRSWRGYREESAKRREERKQQRWAKRNPLPPPLPRSQWLEQQMADAQQDYDAESRLIEESTALDEDERYVAMTKAKQKLLERIDRIIA